MMTYDEGCGCLVPVEEGEAREVGATLRLHADLDHVVLVENTIVLAIKP